MTELRLDAAVASPGLRYLALGDSYTIGEGVPESARWPVQLAHALRADGIPLSDPEIIARTGWTTDELDAAIDSQQPSHDNDLVSLLIGVNNQYRGRSIAEYRTQFAALLQRSIGLARGRAGRVLVLSIPDWGVTPFARRELRSTARIADELDACNTAAWEECVQRDVKFVDITTFSRQHGAETAMLVEDGLHPSAGMYAQWTRLALPAARAMLASP